MKTQAEVYAASLKVWWGRDYGTMCVLDPFTGEVYEFDYAAEKRRLPRWFAWRAMDEKHRRGAGATGSPTGGGAT